MESSTKYLGNPLFLSKGRCNDFDFLKEKVLQWIEGWKSKLVSRAGRTTLIRSVITSIPIYSMSPHEISTNICKQLDSTMCKFWWKGNQDGNKYLTLKSWDRICQLKPFGGLGTRKFKDFNKTFLSNFAWKLALGEEGPSISIIPAKCCT